MEVSSSNGTGSVSAQVEVIKKSTEIQEQQVLKILESASQLSQDTTAQKTGVGRNINITG
jgi:hypothetical protein